MMRWIILLCAVFAITWRKGECCNGCPSPTTETTPGSTATTSGSTATASESTATTSGSTATSSESTSTTPDEPSTTTSDDPSTTPDESSTTPETGTTMPVSEAPMSTVDSGATTTPTPTMITTAFVSLEGPNAGLRVMGSETEVSMAIRDVVNDFCTMQPTQCCPDGNAMVPENGVDLDLTSGEGNTPTAIVEVAVSLSCSTPLPPSVLEMILASDEGMAAVEAALGGLVEVTGVNDNAALLDRGSQMTTIIWAIIGSLAFIILIVAGTCFLLLCRRSMPQTQYVYVSRQTRIRAPPGPAPFSNLRPRRQQPAPFSNFPPRQQQAPRTRIAPRFF